MSHLGAHLLIGLLWLLHWLPARVQAALGMGLGALMHALARSRRRIARRNVELCFPELRADARDALVREHFQWLGRSIVDRALLWFAPPARLRRLVRVEGDATLAERTPGAVMWIVPHFMGLEFAGIATQLFQQRAICSIYQRQSNLVFDRAVRRGRERLTQPVLVARHDGIKPLLRAVRDQGCVFFNLPDQDHGRKDSAFVPFFGMSAATLLAPSRIARMLDMTVQPVVAEMLRGGGWRVRFLPPLPDWPSADAQADAARLNAWLEGEVRRLPAQYLWVHKRFKTRPEGEPPLY
jgi:Kdo2-lipid IVA lauroyltransferase/acyltransferase